ncbi:DnaJ family molecular chaperone [candidate division KSB1 bacterium]
MHTGLRQKIFGITPDQKISKNDFKKLRKIRYRLKELWFPPMEKEIREWRRRSGINSVRSVFEFSKLTDNEKERFFIDADAFINTVDNAYEKWDQKKKISIKKEGFNNAFLILKLPENAPYEDVKKQYHKLVLRSHPDKGGDPEDFIRINNAYQRICSSLNI